jgi:3'-5' exoribonuclease
MAASGAVIIKLSDLVDGQEAVCFAALVRRTRAVTKSNQPYLKCQFRDRKAAADAMIWHDSRFFREADSWVEGCGYRLHVRGRLDIRFGMQLDLLGIRPATDDDARDGYDFSDLVDSSKFGPDLLLKKIQALIDSHITEPNLKRLVENLLADNLALLQKMPAAQNMHHSYNAGLLEHVWSMTRVAAFLGDHYAKYYDDLDPPLNRGIIVAATILHDIGKLRELEYRPLEARYTKEGCLIGHILIGRDMVREAASKIEGFSPELLILLEHAILAHHGKREFGSPVLPQTIEALIVSYIDEMDAKVNIAAREIMSSQTEDLFTDKVYALDNRRLYKGQIEGMAVEPIPRAGLGISRKIAATAHRAEPSIPAVKDQGAS